MKQILGLLAFVAAPVCAQEAPVLEAYVAGEVRESDIRIDAQLMDGTPPVLWTGEISVLATDYIRLLLRVEGEGFEQGAALRLVSVLGQEFDVALSDIGPDGYWTNLLPLGRVQLALVSATVPDATALVIESIAVQSAKGALYSTWGKNEIMPINGPDVPDFVREMAAPVAFLSFIDNGFARTCTGFLIEPDLLATNEHCINSAATCQSMTAVFDYEFDPQGRLSMGPQVRCAGFDETRSNYDLDVSIIRLNRPLGSEYVPIDVTTATSDPQGPLFIVQHPGPQPKQVSFIDCSAVLLNVDGRAPGSDFTHTCDTAGGSSGSPVFNADGALVGVHHFGFMDDRDGIWTENRSTHGGRIGAWWEECCHPQDPE